MLSNDGLDGSFCNVGRDKVNGIRCVDGVFVNVLQMLEIAVCDLATKVELPSVGSLIVFGSFHNVLRELSGTEFRFVQWGEGLVNDSDLCIGTFIFRRRLCSSRETSCLQ